MGIFSRKKEIKIVEEQLTYVEMVDQEIENILELNKKQYNPVLEVDYFLIVSDTIQKINKKNNNFVIGVNLNHNFENGYIYYEITLDIKKLTLDVKKFIRLLTSFDYNNSICGVNQKWVFRFTPLLYHKESNIELELNKVLTKIFEV